MKRVTPAAIKRAYNAANSGHFFDADTMRWFGDTMASFGTIVIDGSVYMYRKPTASVWVFNRRCTAGREFFNAWIWDAETANLESCGTEETQAVFDAI